MASLTIRRPTGTPVSPVGYDSGEQGSQTQALNGNDMTNEHSAGGLSMMERAISAGAGLALAAAAAKPRPNPALSVLALGAGVFLAYRGAVGYCPLKAALAQSS